MNLSSLLYPATVRAHVQLDSKKALFPFVGDLASRSLGLDAGEAPDLPRLDGAPEVRMIPCALRARDSTAPPAA